MRPSAFYNSYIYANILYFSYPRMPPVSKFNQPQDSDKKEEIYIEKQRLMFISGMILFAVFESLDTGDLARLKLIISQFAFENPEELASVRLNDIAEPFKGLKSYNIVRYPDQVWEESMIDESTEKVSTDCPCAVSFYRGEVNVRWTIPRIEYIWQCQSAAKLAYTAMVIVEELFHIRQMITPNSRAITVLGTLLEFDAVSDTAQMEEPDRQLLAKLLENDVTYFFNTYFKIYTERIQWFIDRSTATDMHEPLTPAQFIESIMYLTSKYGYAEEVGETLLADILSFIEMNPELGLQMLLAEGLGKFVNKVS